MGYTTERISQFRGINRSAEPNSLDMGYAYDAVNVDISGGKLTNKIGSVRLVSAVDVPAGVPIILPTNARDYLIIRDKFIDMGIGYTYPDEVQTLQGDANLDDSVTTADASAILRHIKGLSVLAPQGLRNADVNMDGKVTEDDAKIILEHLTGIIDMTQYLGDEYKYEVGPYEPDRFGMTTELGRDLQNVVNDSSMPIRGVGLNAIQARIDNTDCIIASGILGSGSGYYTYRGRLTDGGDAKTAVYYLGSEATPKVHVRKFGSGLYLLKDISVLSKEADGNGVLKSITINKGYSTLTSSQINRIILDGIYLFKSAIGSVVDEDDVNNAYMWLKVTGIESGTNSNAKLIVSTTRQASDVLDTSYAYVRGGCSDMSVTYMLMHYGRLFAAAHPDNVDHPRRLYWSCLPGDGRTIEDWTMSDASIDTSGGHVDVGDSRDGRITGLCACNNQILIFTNYRLFRLYGTAPSNYTLELVGEIEGTRISNPVEVNGSIYWLSMSGIQSYNGSYIRSIDDDYSTRRLLLSFPKELRESFDPSSVHAVLFDNSLMFSIDRNRGMADTCMVLRYELETGNVIKYAVPCTDFLQQFTSSRKANFGKVDGTAVRNETRYFQALVHKDKTMTMTQWYDWGSQEFGWYDEQPIKSLWETGWKDLGSLEATKKAQTVCMRGSGDFDLTVESEVNKSVTHVTMPDKEAAVKDVTPQTSAGRSFRMKIESDKLFEIEPYMTIKYDTGGLR